MKFGNFTGPNNGFGTNFSGDGVGKAAAILWQPATYTFSGQLAAAGTPNSEATPNGLCFKPDGTKVFYVGATANRVKSYDLTIPWDVNSGTNRLQSGGILATTAGTAITALQACTMSNDGTKLFVVDSTTNGIYRYNLPTPWDISSIVVTTNCNADQQNTTAFASNLTPLGLSLNTTGLVFLGSNIGTTVGFRTYTTAVANDITTLTPGTNVATGTLAGVAWMDSGNKLATVNQTGTVVFYSVSPAFSTSSLVSLGTRVISTFDSTTTDIYVKNDGTAFLCDWHCKR